MEDQEFQIGTSAALACSKSCARAGIFALALSCLAFVLIGPLEKLDKLLAYGSYISLRSQLKFIIDDLDFYMENDECWKVINQKESNFKEIEKWNLHKLLEAECTSETSLKGKPIRPTTFKDERTTESRLINKILTNPNPVVPNSQSLKPRTQRADKVPPAPLTLLGLAMNFKLEGINDLEKILLKLNDSELLIRAGGLSHSQNQQITEWMQLRHRMFRAKYSPLGGSAEEKSEIRKKKGLSDESQDVWIYLLTLEDIKNLQKFHHPKVEDFEEAQRAINLFKIPLIQAEVELGFATTFVEFALFSSVAYFLIFLRERKKIPDLFITGTLIGAMGRDRFTVFLFLFFTSIPILASQGLAFSSLHGIRFSPLSISIDWIFAHLTVIFSLMVAWEIWTGWKFHSNHNYA